MSYTPCNHYSLRFAFGGFLIICDLCNTRWQATKENGLPDFRERNGKLGESDHRIRPSESSTRLRKVEAAEEAAQAAKPSDSTKLLRPDP